ncbi:DUF6155 family protein [Shouchella clausii]|uniref:DUF6155 family protein n=1 Tax=Shouchella clausii TaxID=79880 RepID=UPI000B96ECFC|nr:DUF6155 family protein [Shouchella clausii]AST97819.1 hypothetical protein BC8716_18405 [Shouchella clausii]MCR1287473.1 DUF6155 family protein [Shouchella clausii]MEB5474170.1 DUF6155 family protein [Shouchella clausii]QNM44259.1 hypothetical protein DUT88_15720 [Shouchella clausii]WQG97053.1 DUF6155 family protein [Shouchella clausii]
MTNPKKLSIPEIKKALKSYDKESLITLLIDGYKQSQEMKNYIHVLLNPEETIEELYQKSKNQILHEFFPERGDAKMRLSVAKKAITEFKKWCKDEIRTIDLMIYYVEVGVDFANEYGDIYEQFYNSMISMYGNVVDKINNNLELCDRFYQRLKSIVMNTSGMGWGFHEELYSLFGQLSIQVEKGRREGH